MIHVRLLLSTGVSLMGILNETSRTWDSRIVADAFAADDRPRRSGFFTFRHRIFQIIRTTAPSGRRRSHNSLGDRFMEHDVGVREFALKGNVMDLAVGVIIGGAFGKIVDLPSAT